MLFLKSKLLPFDRNFFTFTIIHQVGNDRGSWMIEELKAFYSTQKSEINQMSLFYFGERQYIH